MKKRLLAILLVTTMALSLVACTNTDTSANADKAEEIQTVEISYGLWGDEDREEYTMKQIAAFEEEYPYITVKLNYTTWDNLNAQMDDIMEDGRESDVLQINYDWLERYSPDGNGFYDLNELSDVVRLDAFSEVSIKYGQVNGKQNALPNAFNTSVPIYNKTMYDYYKLPLPESVEELFADAQIMKEDGVYQLGMEDKQILLFLCGCYENETGIDVEDGDGNLKMTDRFCTYLAETYKKCLDSYVICPREVFSDTRIEGNRVAGVICWLNSIEKYKGIISDAGNEPEVGKFLWTDIEATMGNYVKPSTMMAISANTQHPKEAALLLDFLMNDETAVDLQGVDKGVPDSRLAQQHLMKAGELMNDTFYTTLRLNYYLEYLHTVPAKLEDKDVAEEILTALDAYADGSSSLSETVSALKGIQ